MAGSGERRKKPRQDAGAAENNDVSSVNQAARKRDDDEVPDGQPVRRIPGLNGYDPTQWPDAAR